MNAQHALAKRIIIDLDLLNTVIVEVTRIKQEMVDEKAFLTPQRRAHVFEALSALQAYSAS